MWRGMPGAVVRRMGPASDAPAALLLTRSTVQRLELDSGRLAVLFRAPAGIELRDLIAGEPVVVGMDGIRLVTDQQHQDSHSFAFMLKDVSSERRVEVHARAVADLARKARQAGKKVVWVPGPVIVHTGASSALSQLAAEGWVDVVLSGNALAVHDIEAALMGTSLGVSVKDGQVVEHGHSHHMRAIDPRFKDLWARTGYTSYFHNFVSG